MDVESPTSGPTPGSSVPERFDHLSPELSGVLYPDARSHAVDLPGRASDEHGGFWVVTDYEDVLKVAQDWDTFSSAHGLTVPPAPIATRNIPVEVDPPEHRVYKRLINRYFTPAAVAEWEDGTRALITRLIDDFIEEGHCEFMGSFARPLPARTFFEFALGAPQDDVEKVAYLASKSSTPNDPEAAACWKGLSEWITGFLDGRRADGRGGDVVDAVLDARIDGRPITHDEAVGIVQLLILGGLETTAGALGMMMVRLSTEPSTREQLAGSKEVAPEAIEELLRLDAAVHRDRPHGHPRHRARRSTDRRGRQGHHLLGGRQPGRVGVPARRHLRPGSGQQPPPELRRRPASGSGPRSRPRQTTGPSGTTGPRSGRTHSRGS